MIGFPVVPEEAWIRTTSASGRTWLDFRDRLRNHGPRLAAMGVSFYRSPQVPWSTGLAVE